MVAFGAQGGVTEDSWPGFVGFLEDNPTPLVSEQNLKNFPSYPLESVNITVLEPCNTVSNWAFHQAMVEVCESTEWFSEEEWLTGLIRAFHFMGPGSTFMHASGTSVGREADNESIRQLAWWYLQYGLQELPYDPIIHDLSEEPAPRTALEVIQDLNEMILNEPATSWDQTIRAYYTLPYENTFSAVAIALLHRVFYRSKTVEKLTDILADLLVSGQDLDFIKERYSPTVREAILQKDVNTSPLNRLQLLLQFTGTMMKIIWAFYWQEETIVGDHLTRRWSNVLGSVVTPFVNALSNVITGFNRSGSPNLQFSRNAYPGDNRCNRRHPHSKWHEIAANGLVDVALTAKSLNKLLAGESLTNLRSISGNSVVQCYEKAWAAESEPFDSDLFSADTQDELLGGILEECFSSNLFDFGRFLSCLTNKMVWLSKSTAQPTHLEQCLVDNECIVFNGTDFNAKRLHDCVFPEGNSPCVPSVPSSTTNLEACLVQCSSDFLCAVACLQEDFSPWLRQTISCVTVLSSPNPSAAAVAGCQKIQSQEQLNTATAFLTMLTRFASISQSPCSNEHATVLRNFASSKNCFRVCSNNDGDIPLDFPCVIQCMALS